MNFEKYEVYEDGRIWSYSHKKWLKPKTEKNGYQRVCLYDNEGKKKLYLVHRVVYEAVTGESIPEGYEINHISEAKDENFFANLQLISHKENCNFGTRNERVSKALSKQVGAFKDGKLVMTFPSTQECGRQGFERSAVTRCCNGKLPHYKGYTWKYI